MKYLFVFIMVLFYALIFPSFNNDSYHFSSVHNNLLYITPTELHIDVKFPKLKGG